MFTCDNPKGMGTNPDVYVLLVKTLYSLKQAGWEWNQELDNKLRRQGYACLRSDPCIYIWHTSKDFTIITVWVDDLLIFTTMIRLQDKARADINQEWKATDLDKPTKIVRIKISYTLNAITISQSKYIESILHKEKMDKYNSVSTPLEPNPEGNNGDRSNSFARLLGELQFLANATCPDIAYAVNRLASYMANPSFQHVCVLKCVLRYLLGM